MRRILLFSMALIINSSCQKKESTTTGNPMVSLSISSSQNVNPIAKLNFNNFIQNLLFPSALASVPPSILDLASNTIVLDQGWMVVKEVEFKATELPDSNEVDGDDVKFFGPYAVDLFASSPVSLGSAPLALTSVQRIKMKLHAAESVIDGQPSALLNNSIYFHGTVAGKEFSIISTEGTEFEVGGATPLNIRDQMNLLLSIRIVPLINKIDFSALSSESSGVVISDSYKVNASTPCPSIDSSSSTIYDCFRKGIEQQADLGDDRDSDGDLDSDEDGVR